MVIGFFQSCTTNDTFIFEFDSSLLDIQIGSVIDDTSLSSKDCYELIRFEDSGTTSIAVLNPATTTIYTSCQTCNQPTPTPTPTPTQTPQANLLLCNDAQILTSQISGDSYSWSVDTGSGFEQLTTTTETHIALFPGLYKVEITNGQEVTELLYNVSLDNNCFTCYDNNETLTLTSVYETQDTLFYQWFIYDLVNDEFIPISDGTGEDREYITTEENIWYCFTQDVNTLDFQEEFFITTNGNCNIPSPTPTSSPTQTPTQTSAITQTPTTSNTPTITQSSSSQPTPTPTITTTLFSLIKNRKFFKINDGVFDCGTYVILRDCLNNNAIIVNYPIYFDNSIVEIGEIINITINNQTSCYELIDTTSDEITNIIDTINGVFTNCVQCNQ